MRTVSAERFFKSHFDLAGAFKRPYCVYLELTHRCDFDCVHCYVDRRGPPAKEMDLEQYGALARSLAKLGVMADDDGMNLPGGLRFSVVKARLLRLAEAPGDPEPDGLDPLRLSLAGVGIALLVFFVVA